MKNLGYANGWTELPLEVAECRDKGHITEHKQEGRCLNRTTCTQCDYTYLVDSSD